MLSDSDITAEMHTHDGIAHSVNSCKYCIYVSAKQNECPSVFYFKQTVFFCFKPQVFVESSVKSYNSVIFCPS